MKKLLLVATAVAILLPSVGQAGCQIYGMNSLPPAVNPNVSDGTHPVMTQQASNTWQDWVWRGSNNGDLYQCPYNNVGPCPYTWTGIDTVTIGYSVGAGVSATGGLGDSVKGVLGASLSYTYSKSTTTGSTYAPGASASPGYFMEPIWVQLRRWSSGTFQGFWITYSTTGNGTKGSPYVVCQSWNASRQAGYWSSNFAQGAPYKTFNIYK